jgi:hypothetical protein
MKNTVFYVSILLLSVFILINLLNGYGLNKKTQKVLKRYDVEFDSISCRTKMNDRSGFCIYKATPNQNKKLASNAKLKKFVVPKRSINELINDSSLLKNFGKEQDKIYRFSGIKKGPCWKYFSSSKIEIYLDLNYPSFSGFSGFTLLYSAPEKFGCFEVGWGN